MIMMKNFNRHSSHGHHGLKRHKLAQHTHTRGSHAFTYTVTSTQLQPRCAERQLSYNRIWNQIFILKVPEGYSEGHNVVSSLFKINPWIFVFKFVSDNRSLCVCVCVCPSQVIPQKLLKSSLSNLAQWKIFKPWHSKCT